MAMSARAVRSVTDSPGTARVAPMLQCRVEGAAVVVDGFSDAGPDFLGDIDGLIKVVQTRQQDQNLITAGPPDGVTVARTERFGRQRSA